MVEVPAPSEPTSDKLETSWTHSLAVNFGATVVSEFVKKKTDTSRHPDAPTVTVLVATDSVQIDGCHSFCNEGETEIDLQVVVWPHSHDTSHIPR